MTKPQNRVLVVMNRFQGYEKSIPEAIEALGHDAQWSDARFGNSFLVKLFTRLGLLQRIPWLMRRNSARIISEARSFGADTLLLISPETLRAPEIRQLQAALPGVRIILYLYDSSDNRYLDQDMIDAVDVAASFDMDDCDKFDGLALIPLFHHHRAFTTPTAQSAPPLHNYCFIGTGRVRRIKMLAGIARKAHEGGESCFFYLYAPSALQYALFRLCAALYGYTGTVSRKSVPFQTYLDTLAQSACVVDIEQKNQGGLTIRTMDAVFAGRPFATSNGNIARHDFYPHFPISVFDDEVLDISVPKARESDAAEQFYHKYHIQNWAATVLAGDPPSYRLEATVSDSAPETASGSGAQPVGRADADLPEVERV